MTSIMTREAEGLSAPIPYRPSVQRPPSLLGYRPLSWMTNGGSNAPTTPLAIVTEERPSPSTQQTDEMFVPFRRLDSDNTHFYSQISPLLHATTTTASGVTKIVCISSIAAASPPTSVQTHNEVNSTNTDVFFTIPILSKYTPDTESC